jgi:integrase
MKMRLPRYVQAFTDRHGKARYYYRRAGFERVALPGLPYSSEFMAAYERAGAAGIDKRKTVCADRTLPGTFNALAVAFLESGEFKALSQSTQKTYRGWIDAFRAKNGDFRVKSLEMKHIQRQVSNRADRPFAATNLLRMYRLLMKFAVVHGWRSNDPTIGVKPPKVRSAGFYTWSEADIKKFEDKHPIGSRARFALALLLFTAQRRGDVIRMGRQHIREGVLTIRQNKTGTLVEIPVHTDLCAIIDATPSSHLTFLTTEHGRSFSVAGFGNWFREVCDQAGLPKGCAAHGLRKAAARRLAEAGCTAHEIMSITGHRTLREVTRYTEAADRRHLARSAIAKTTKGNAGVKPG